MANDLTFGVFIPQGWKMELASIPDPQAKWQRAVETAVRAEELGYDHLWVYDHVHNVPVPAHETMFEAWTTVAAISQRTSRIGLGQMVGCTSYRNPSLLAKITATVDVISGGRLEWGIGAGWYDNEYKAYGYDFPSAGVRIAMLAECVQIVKAMWTEADATFHGEHFTIDGAQCDPKPLQSPHPNIWIGGGGERKTLRVVAEHATHSNFGGKPHEWAHKSEVLERHCKDVGRPFDEITRTWSPEMFVRETEAEIGTESRSFWGEPFESWRDGNLVGTPDQVAEKLQAYIDLGCRGFVPWCADYPDHTSMELFATQVMPQLR
ncbi:MAG: family F420-dependent class oxidoreductase [Acidimicrobiales bacterium]|nr:family F420-dependent class oxidoreductase [Acidimicrobiales bacterium]